MHTTQLRLLRAIAIGLALATLVLNGCARPYDLSQSRFSHVGSLELTQSQRNYWETIRSTPVESGRRTGAKDSPVFRSVLTVESSRAPVVWERALEFLNRYSGFPPEKIMAEDRSLATVGDRDLEARAASRLLTRTTPWTYKWSYEIVRRSPQNNRVQFEVYVSPGGVEAAQQATGVEKANARNNLRILVHFLRTGRIEPELLAPEPEEKPMLNPGEPQRI